MVLNLSIFGSEKIRVACVGDSITYGYGIANPADRYPNQLANMLGENYLVGNFGVSGATLLSDGTYPYVKLKAYFAALEFKPNIVIIKLGTNDTKNENWEKILDFEGDLNKLVDSFEKLETKPTIYLCTSCPIFGSGVNLGDKRVSRLIPVIKKVAKDHSIKIIDIRSIFEGKPELVPDRVHPNEAGAKLIAEAVKNAILAK